jgi:hypothetical protein
MTSNFGNQDCSILISSCDAYSDLWDSFFSLFRKFWPDNPFEIYLSAETKNYQNKYFDIHVINDREGNKFWSRRIVYTLSKIKTKYVILILDDFYLYDAVNTASIFDCIGYMRLNPQVASFTFFPISLDTVESSYPGWELRRKEGKFKVLSILALWNKEILTEYLSADENIWEWEANASKRSNYRDDEFFVESSNATKTFPYDFRKYGLLGGKWLKDTAGLFSDNGIHMDFSIRGYYDENSRASSTSIISSIELDSSLIPYYALTKDVDPCMRSSYPIVKKGKFRQYYEIDGARKVIRWEPSCQYGFVVGGFKCTIVYQNNKKSIIRAKDIIGNYIYFKRKMFFTIPDPYIYILPKTDDLISSLCIEGVLLNPPNPKAVDEAIKYPVVGVPEIYSAIVQKLFFEFLISPEKMFVFRTNSKLVLDFGDEYCESNAIQDVKKRHAGPFRQEYKIDCGAAIAARWDIADVNGFAIQNLKVCVDYADGRNIELGHQDISGEYIRHEDCYVFMSLSQSIGISFPEAGPKAISLTGNLLCPMPKELLQEIYRWDLNN